MGFASTNMGFASTKRYGSPSLYDKEAVNSLLCDAVRYKKGTPHKNLLESLFNT